MLRKISLLLVFCFSVQSLAAQRVGLVLSGGGAKGLYHIGIIKALEENGIPIDYVAGTSMGAIIAGMYAAGYSPQEMEQAFSSPEVSYWLSGTMEPQYSFYYNQLPSRPAMITANINFAALKKAFTPKGKEKTDTYVGTNLIPGTKGFGPQQLVSSDQLDMGLMSYFAGANAVSGGDFDSLFVPFRCVSSDVIAKKPYVWDKGNLSLAIRASMAIPIVFSPVLVDSTVMYDGGVYNNFPWAEMKEIFDPDVIIGGRCVSGATPDITTTTGQIETLVMQPTDYNMPSELGIVVGRNIGVSVLDFSKPEVTIEQGYQDALAAMPEIKKRIARRVSPYEVYQKRMAFKARCPVPVFDGKSILQLNSAQPKYIDRQLKKGRIPEDAVSLSELKSQYFRTLSQGTKKAGFPEAIYNDSTGLFDFKVEIKSRPTLTIGAGLNISSASINQGYLGLRYNTNNAHESMIALDGYLGSFYSSAQISSRHNMYNKRLPYYLYTTLTYNFDNYIRQNNQRLSYKHTENYSLYKLNEFYFSNIIGFPVSRSQKLEFRLSVGNDKLKYFLEENADKRNQPDRTGLFFLNLNVSMKRNSLNYPAFPTRGLKQVLSAGVAYGREKFVPGSSSLVTGQYGVRKNHEIWGSIRFEREDYYQLARFFSVGYKVEGVYSNLPNFTNDFVYRSMAPYFVSTYHSGTLFLRDFSAASYIGVGVMPTFEINEKLYLKSELYLFKPDLNNYKNITTDSRIVVGTSFVYQSPIGPISLSYNYMNVSMLKNHYLVFNLGYMLFNKRGIVY